MRHSEKIYETAIAWLLLIAATVTGCTATDEILPSPDEAGTTETTLLVRKTRAPKIPAPDASSTEEEILEYLRTLNGDFETGNKIRIANNVHGKVPDFTQKKEGDKGGNNGYFEYYCIENDTTPDGYYKFQPTDNNHKLRWRDSKEEETDDPNLIFTTAAFYTFNALYYWDYKGTNGFSEITIHDEGQTNGIYGYVLPDQSNEVNFRLGDIMQAHHLKDSKTQFGEVIKLRFWHQLSMVVINVSVPYDEENYGVGFTRPQMEGAACMLTDFYCGFYLPYNLDVASDESMPINHTEDEGKKDIIMWPVAGSRIDEDANGAKLLVRTYAALVPPQTKTGEKFCRFVINGKNYTYTSGNAELLRAEMSIIDLHINPENDEPILLNARILPWDEVKVPDFPLYPEM